MSPVPHWKSPFHTQKAAPMYLRRQESSVYKASPPLISRVTFGSNTLSKQDSFLGPHPRNPQISCRTSGIRNFLGLSWFQPTDTYVCGARSSEEALCATLQLHSWVYAWWLQSL